MAKTPRKQIHLPEPVYRRLRAAQKEQEKIDEKTYPLGMVIERALLALEGERHLHYHAFQKGYREAVLVGLGWAVGSAAGLLQQVLGFGRAIEVHQSEDRNLLMIRCHETQRAYEIDLMGLVNDPAIKAIMDGIKEGRAVHHGDWPPPPEPRVLLQDPRVKRPRLEA